MHPPTAEKLREIDDKIDALKQQMFNDVTLQDPDADEYEPEDVSIIPPYQHTHPLMPFTPPYS